MYRPGGFPEYTPDEQRVFDVVYDIIRSTFEKRNFQHIRTPAVEKNEILLKGGESVANEIFGLSGLKNQQVLQDYIKGLDYNNDDFPSHLVRYIFKSLKKVISTNSNKTDHDIIDNINNDNDFNEILHNNHSGLNKVPTGPVFKDYSLHFDLTVPFARYTLDHISKITFPFKRYQMQPVWRGERHQKGRFKEFWQCDVDSIWRSETSVGFWYGCETITTLQDGLRTIFKKFSIKQKFVSHISHIGLIKSFLSNYLSDDLKIKEVMSLLDRYYKIKDSDEFKSKLYDIAGFECANLINDMILSKDYLHLQKYNLKGFQELDNTIKTLKSLGASIEFDITIVRGLGYYTNIVFETFIKDEISLGSICSGGGYEDFTKFIDSKQLFSGIGGSIGLSRVMEIILDSPEKLDNSKTYFFINFEETFDKILLLYRQFAKTKKQIDIYPTSIKFGKQLEYANKKGMQYAIILGSDELARGIYKVKDLRTGEETEKKLESKK